MVAVGAGPCGPYLRQLSGELKLDGAVTWLGDISRSQLIAEYNRADIFCLPSVQEGFGIVLLEAMAAGKPIVAARAAAIPEVAPHGLLVEPDSEEALEAGIERYQKVGCWEGGVEIPRDLYEQALNVFQTEGVIAKRQPYEEVCTG